MHISSNKEKALNYSIVTCAKDEWTYMQTTLPNVRREKNMKRKRRTIQNVNKPCSLILGERAPSLGTAATGEITKIVLIHPSFSCSLQVMNEVDARNDEWNCRARMLVVGAPKKIPAMFAASLGQERRWEIFSRDGGGLKANL